MKYQLPNGKVIFITVEEFLQLTDEDIQYLISIDYGDYVPHPFSDTNKECYYDFDDFLSDSDDEKIIGTDNPFDDIVDIASDLDI
jgi:hypothetical protein